MLQILGFRALGKATCREPWVDTAGTLSPPSVRGVFWNRQFQPSRVFLILVQLGPLRGGTFRGFAEGWFPKGWFWRIFPRNENRNEGTFAKTTLLLNRPFISQWAFLVLTKGWFPKGWFRRMFPRSENRNEGTFPKTTLLRNRPFISQWTLAVREGYGQAIFWGDILGVPRVRWPMLGSSTWTSFWQLAANSQKLTDDLSEAGCSDSRELSCTRLRVPPVALHVSRYTCRSWFPGF